MGVNIQKWPESRRGFAEEYQKDFRVKPCQPSRYYNKYIISTRV